MRITGITLRQLELGFDQLGPTTTDLSFWRSRRKPNCAVINPSKESRSLYAYFPPLFEQIIEHKSKFLSFFVFLWNCFVPLFSFWKGFYRPS